MNVLIIMLLLSGVLLFFATTVGIIRFPDFYTRMHAAGKGDTLSSLLMLGGLVIYELHEINLATILVGFKILLIVVFIFMASPTATHSIIDAGLESGAEPWQKDKAEGEA